MVGSFSSQNKLTQLFNKVYQMYPKFFFTNVLSLESMLMICFFFIRWTLRIDEDIEILLVDALSKIPSSVELGFKIDLESLDEQTCIDFFR